MCYYFWQRLLAFIIVPYKGISIPESGKFWLVELGIQEFLAWNPGILQFGIQLKETGTLNPTSTDKESQIQYLARVLESKTSWNSFLNVGRFLKCPAVTCRTILWGLLSVYRITDRFICKELTPRSTRKLISPPWYKGGGGLGLDGTPPQSLCCSILKRFYL